jgi:subtilisin family serine protease
VRERTGRGVRIGLLDTGVDSRHLDLAGRIKGNYEARIDVPQGRVVACGHGEDHNEHGTACAGILARLAPGAEIHSVQVIGAHPRDTPLKLLAGFRFAVAHRWDIINVSAGMGTPRPELRELADAAWTAGLIVIAAKDNRPGVVGYPAAFPNVLAVDMEHFADPLSFRFVERAEVEVEASGIYIDAPRAGGGRQYFTGSSFAAPHLAAIAARLKEHFPELNGESLRTALKQLSRSASGIAPS